MLCSPPRTQLPLAQMPASRRVARYSPRTLCTARLKASGLWAAVMDSASVQVTAIHCRVVLHYRPSIPFAYTEVSVYHFIAFSAFTLLSHRMLSWSRVTCPSLFSTMLSVGPLHSTSSARCRCLCDICGLLWIPLHPVITHPLTFTSLFSLGENHLPRGCWGTCLSLLLFFLFALHSPSLSMVMPGVSAVA
jgi:hypothetical protein